MMLIDAWPGSNLITSASHSVYACVPQPSSQRPVYPQTHPPPGPSVQTVPAAPADVEPSQVRQWFHGCSWFLSVISLSLFGALFQHMPLFVGSSWRCCVSRVPVSLSQSITTGGRDILVAH